jgi:DNA-binding response OmpR family regulator
VPTRTRSILVVDDDEDFGVVVVEVLEHEGYRARHVTTAAGARAILARGNERPDACLLDWNLPEGNPVDLARLLTVMDVPIVLSSGSPGSDEAAHRIGASAILDKPFDIDDLSRLLSGLFRERDAAAASHHDTPHASP